MGKVVMNASVSVDGFIAAENDDPGPIFEWLVSGDVPLDDSGVLKVSQVSFRRGIVGLEVAASASRSAPAAAQPRAARPRLRTGEESEPWQRYSAGA